MNTCLNFGVSNLRDNLLTDRVTVGVTVEDVDFLDDQLVPRKRWSMSNKEDQEFATRKAASHKRKLPPVPIPPKPFQTSASHDDYDDDGDEKVSDDDNKENKDKDYVPSKSRKKEPARITASVPRNLVSPALTSSLDRTKSSGRSAMRNLSVVVSTFTTPDGDKIGLDSFVLSRSSIERRKQNDRQIISVQAELEFLENLPEHLACHWDGKLIDPRLLRHQAGERNCDFTHDTHN